MEEIGNNSKTFGDLIAELRNKKNMTQKELAEKLMVSDKTISRWENNGSLPDMTTIEIISKYFKVPIEDLTILRVKAISGDSELVRDIVNGFTKRSNRWKRIFKITILFLSIALLFSIGVIIFTNSYNRFKVYSVSVESDDFYLMYGTYVETKIKDSLYLNTINIRNYTQKDGDVISTDLYYIENDEEYILHSYSRLININFVTYDSYIPIDNLSNYFDKLYLRVTIIDSKNKETVYNSKLQFTLDFSNNKIYKNDKDVIKSISNKLSPNDIKNILLKNNFEEVADGLFYIKNQNIKIHYILSSNKFTFDFCKNNLDYRYTYDINRQRLEVHITNKNNIELENYIYETYNNKIIECIAGKCNSYNEAVNIIRNNLSYLFK